MKKQMMLISAELYIADDGTVLQREYSGLSPGGIRFGGAWVLRAKGGKYIDCGRDANDVSVRYCLELEVAKREANPWRISGRPAPKPTVPYPPCFSGITSKTKGMRLGEISLFTSGTSCGKSTMLRDKLNETKKFEELCYGQHFKITSSGPLFVKVGQNHARFSELPQTTTQRASSATKAILQPEGATCVPFSILRPGDCFIQGCNALATPYRKVDDDSVETAFGSTIHWKPRGECVIQTPKWDRSLYG